jgi:hypothetical protein
MFPHHTNLIAGGTQTGFAIFRAHGQSQRMKSRQYANNYNAADFAVRLSSVRSSITYAAQSSAETSVSRRLNKGSPARIASANCCWRALICKRFECFTVSPNRLRSRTVHYSSAIILPSRMVHNRVQTDALYWHAIRDCSKHFVADISQPCRARFILDSGLGHEERFAVMLETFLK